MHGVQERACQLTAALAMDDAACGSCVPDGVRGLLDLCSSSVAPSVREQACFALCQIARPSPGCHACVHLQALGASQVLLQLLKGMFVSWHDQVCSSSLAVNPASVAVCTLQVLGLAQTVTHEQRSMQPCCCA